jgi:methyl-accepting chemotaxis protein
MAPALASPWLPSALRLVGWLALGCLAAWAGWRGDRGMALLAGLALAAWLGTTLLTAREKRAEPVPVPAQDAAQQADIDRLHTLLAGLRDTAAQEAREVAARSRRAADAGLAAMRDANAGMDAIRDQIQHTAKRIKRLGESSLEIGQATALIADITDQTQLLALNAAIQAASAGEAGRGFAVVAGEVQRLAVRSAQATRQIASLVEALQADTQQAAAAMDRATQDVVAGARLSDSAGAALAEIDGVSRQLAALIEQLGSATGRDAPIQLPSHDRPPTV